MREPMASSQPDSKIFSVRIVSIDYYMAPPIPNFDICYSNFQGGKVNEVPVIRIYGSTPSGQKTCLHVHRAFPYLYVPCSDIPLNQHQEGSAYTNAVSLAVEKALKLKSSAGSKRQHVHGCSLVRAKKFYGYHSPEELFVKIYLYHPHDVSRAANLLLGGAAFDKSLQPHESHIPFILQFLVDCNLYGMGHVHLSKIKFRHPVPDSFPRGKLNFDREHEIKLDMPTCISTDSPADLYVGDCFASPVWVSSTIPCGWTWDFSSELGTPLHQDDHSVKRQSICELEGDATIDDILNKQFITYTSLSQTRSDVKMVQSLIPIWEEEYERTGMHGAAVPPDPGKPLPEDVLKTLSHGLGFEQNIADYLVNSEENLALMEDDIKHIQSVTPLSNEGNFVELENVNSNCTDGHLPENWPLQGYVYEKEVNSGLVGTEDASPQLLSASNIQCSDTTGTSDTKATDKEALGLLKWLATSHAVEDINSDDELVRETILSPLLPAATIVKVLEKANIDYESESQKECQDILDSVEEKDGASDSVDHNHHPHSSSDKKIPQVDGLHSSPMGSAENPCMVELNSQSKRHSHYKVLQTTARNFSGKQKRKKSSWCSLPFSITQKVNDNPEAVRCNIVKLDDAEDKNYVGPNVAVNEGADDSVSLAETIDTHARETSSLVGCSLRDLMRQKRCRRVSQEDGGYVGVTKNYSEGEGDECNILLRKRLDLDTLQDDKAEEIRPGSLNVRPLESNKQTEHPNANFCKPVSSGFHLDSITHPACGSNSQLQAGSHLILGESESKELQFPCRSKKQDLSIVLGHFESNNNKEFEFGDATNAETITNVCNLKSDFLSDNHLSEGKFVADKTLDHMDPAGSKCLSASPVEHVMFVTGSHEHKSGRGGRGSLQKLSEIPDENIVGMSVPVDATVPQSENFCAQKQQNDLPVFRGLVSVAVDVEGGNVDLTGMTSFKKAPIADWKQAASSSSSLSSTLSCHPAVVNEENKGGTSGSASDEILPFFEEDCKKKIGVEYKNSACNIQEEAILGIPTHYQNDGSVLYLLRPILSPPSTDCVNRWLAQNNRGVSEEIAAESAEHVHMKGSSEVGSQRSSAVDFNKELTKPDHASHLMPIVDHAQQEINRKPQRESPRHCDDGHTVLLQIEREIAKSKTFGDFSGDISQISGPDGRSRLTPLSQIGFRDPATTGAGQQLTLLSLEVQAESRGDLRPNPRFDPVNVLALAFQNDHEAGVDVYVFLHSRSEPDRRDSYGISGCKVFSFSDERKLFSHFIRTIGALDPDIIMGWDVQGGSLGFLAERAAHLGIGLLNKISRTPLEAKMGSKESEFSDNDILDTALHESLIGDSVLADDSVIEDEWGRTHASGVHVGGRVVLNIWRLMRGEVKLNLYTLEAVGEAVLRQKIPSFPDKVLTKWFASGPGRARYRCIEYVIERAQLNLEIMNRLDMINRTSELARVFGIDFFSVLSRGSQYRVESMFLRLAHTQNYLAISPGSQQVASQPAMECLPLVMEPESGFYKDPVIVLDFQSLYPSMIIGYNLCFCTCLGNVAPSKANTLGVSSFSPDPRALQDLKDKILLTPNGVMYVTSKVRKGILPRLLEEILSTRIMVKQAMKKLSSSQQVLYRIFNARQLALKLIANVTYGYTAAGFSGRMPCAELADSIVQCGRNTLEKAISLVNANDKWKAKVVYGDTDSMFVLLKGRSVKEAFQIGREIASAVTAINPDPVTLKLEKVYHPCFLLTKKRYVGYSYESADQIEPVFDAKGIETVRRDTCSAVAKTMEQSLRLFFEHQDISEVKTYLQRQWTRILSGRVSIQDFVFAKEVRLGTYSARTASLPPAAIVATKAIRADPRAEPCYGERVPYVVVHGEPGARLVDMVVDPLELLAIDSPFRLNDIYYITKQIIPALQRVFGLVGADLNQWFLEMPRPVREAFSKRPMCAPNPQRTRIDFYYTSKHCVLCGELVQASARICNKCMQKEDAAATALIGRTSKLEKEMQHLAAICRHCGGGDWILESGVKCTSLACSVFYERRKVQKDLQGLSSVAAEKSFYPKCTIEWF